MLQREEPTAEVAGAPRRPPAAPARPAAPRVRAPSELSGATPRRDIPPITQAELNGYKVTTSLVLMDVSQFGLESGGHPVTSIMPGRDDSYAANGVRGGRMVALVSKGLPRTELSPPESLEGFDGRRIGGKLLHLCTVVSRLPRNLLVELILADRPHPLREISDMDEPMLGAFAALVAQRGNRGVAADISDLHKWRSLIAEFRSKLRHAPSLFEEPRFSLANWEGANGFEEVKVVGGSFSYLKDGRWHPGRAETLGVEAPASVVELILGKLPPDVVVDLHETFPDEALAEVLEMGREKAMGFANYLANHFEQIKTVVTWVKALRHFEAFWREGSCFSFGVDDAERSAWIGKALDQVYRRNASRQNLHAWVTSMRSTLDRFNSSGVTAADVAAFASSPAVLKDTRVESVSLQGGNIRIVLKEPIFARVIKQGNYTYREDVPGTRMLQHPIAAFDLLYGNGNFPNAIAYADKACTRYAKHANVGSAGRVCMGDLSAGGEAHQTGTLNDFLRMMVVWNLDSAHHSEQSYLMKVPAAPPEGRAGGWWTTWHEGLVKIEMGFVPLPDVPLDGAGMGTVELVED